MKHKPNECILVSKYLKKDEGYDLFRFYGVYRGKYIKRVRVEAPMTFNIGENYVLTLLIYSVNNFTLYAKVKKATILEDYSWL